MKKVLNHSLLLVLLFAANDFAAGQQQGNNGNNRITQWLPQCFRQARQEEYNNGMIMPDGFSVQDQSRSVMGCIQDTFGDACFAADDQAETEGEDEWDSLAVCVNHTMRENEFFPGNGNDNDGDGYMDGDMHGDSMMPMMQQQGQSGMGQQNGQQGMGQNNHNGQGQNQQGQTGMGQQNGQQGMGQQNGRRPSFGRMFCNATRDCMAPYADCIRDTVGERVDQLEPCMQTTLRDMRLCARNNRETCRGQCQGSLVSTTTSTITMAQDDPSLLWLEDVQASALNTCSDIQTTLMDPLCDAVNCCEACLPQFEAVMYCIVNNVMNITTTTQDGGEEEECALVCAAASAAATTETNSTSNRRSLQDDTTTSTTQDSSTCLEYAPGLTGTDASELEARSSVFFPCVIQEYALSMNYGKEDMMGSDHNEDNHSSSPAAFQGVGLVCGLLFRFVALLL